MTKLTEQEVASISRIINNTNIQSSLMKEDLIDHFCCAIEEEMSKGNSFEESYDKAHHNICPDGFDEIQKETIFLLTCKSIKAMKKWMYLSAYLLTLSATVTIYLKVTHTQGGGVALLASFFLLVFVFLPLLFMHQYKHELSKNTTSKLLYLGSFIGLALICSTAMFYWMHWPGVAVLLLCGLIVLNGVSLPLLFFKMYRKLAL